MSYLLCYVIMGFYEWKYVQNFGGVTSYKKELG